MAEGTDQPKPLSDGAIRPPRRRPIPGKGHAKSKRGCFNCRRRRVKCSEDRPGCQACRRLGLECEYPELRPSLAPPDRVAMRATLSTLKYEDLRFFHHFMTAAHPQVPFGLEAVWRDVAAMSHEYDFLVHAILGLAAQHLTTCTASDYSVQALAHRVAAMAALNESLSRTCHSKADSDARYAAAMVLTFQSSYMADGMMEFLAMMRGWMIVETSVVPSRDDSIFRSFTREAYVESMKSAMQSSPRSAVAGVPDELENFKASLRVLAPACQSVAELEYLASMERIAAMAGDSPHEACLALVPLYAMTNKMDTKEYAAFADPHNRIAQALLAHFWMLVCLMEDGVLGVTKPYALRRDVALSWVEKAALGLPASHKAYAAWPLGMARRLRSSLTVSLAV